jgi:hypothetical protein
VLEIFKGEVRNEVCIINDTVTLSNDGLLEICEIEVAHSWLTKCVEVLNVAVYLLHIEGAQNSDGSAKAVSGDGEECVGVE